MCVLKLLSKHFQINTMPYFQKKKKKEKKKLLADIWTRTYIGTDISTSFLCLAWRVKISVDEKGFDISCKLETICM